LSSATIGGAIGDLCGHGPFEMRSSATIGGAIGDYRGQRPFERRLPLRSAERSATIKVVRLGPGTFIYADYADGSRSGGLGA
ncbi:MAG: hypothetical protein AAGI63_16300, partial [Planctomycetota bacterium]